MGTASGRSQDKVNKNMKQAQSRKKTGRGLDTRDDEGAAEAAAAPRRWTDYTVFARSPLPPPRPTPHCGDCIKYFYVV